MKIRGRKQGGILSIIILISIVCTSFFVTEALCYSDESKDVVINEIVNYLKGKKVRLSNEKLTKMANTLYEESRLNSLDYRLVLAIIKVESGFKIDARSRDGAQGLMQIKPSLARMIAKNTGNSLRNIKELHEPDNNIRLGIRHMARLMDDFESLRGALCAYNTGHRKARARTLIDREPRGPFTNRVLREYHKNIDILPEP